MKRLMAIVGMVLFTLNAQAADKLAPVEIEGSTSVDYEGVVDLITAERDLVIIDARPLADYETGYIEGAVNLINDDIDSREDLAPFVSAEDTPILVYCQGRACGRAADGVERIVALGYENVYYYPGGIDDWTAEDMPLAMPE
jgi:rhodanese-related sulfurtransferase